MNMISESKNVKLARSNQQQNTAIYTQNLSFVRLIHNNFDLCLSTLFLSKV